MHEMRTYLQVGLIHFMAFPQVMKGEGPILETLRRIVADEYFDAVEVTWMRDDTVRRQAKAMLETTHITVAYGAQPRLLTAKLNINDLDEARRQQAIDTLKAGIDEAYELGCTGLAFLSGPYDEARREDAFAALLDSTRQLCAYAQAKGDLQIVHEVFDFDIEKKSLVGPVELARRYGETMRAAYANFGLMVDLSHLPLLRESSEAAILPIKEYLVHAHLGNCVVADPGLPGYGDQHPRFGFPGGENDVPQVVAFLKALHAAGFLDATRRPIVSFEVKPFGDEDPELVIAGAKRTLNAAWARFAWEA